MSSDEAARAGERTVRVDPRAWPDFGPAGADPDRRRDRAAGAVFVVFLVPDVVRAVSEGRPGIAVAALARGTGPALRPRGSAARGRIRQDERDERRDGGRRQRAPRGAQPDQAVRAR